MKKKINTDSSLANCLFESAKLTKSADLDKYKYTGYSIGFYSPSEFLLTEENYGKNVIIFGTDTSSSVHVDNILGEEATQRLGDYQQNQDIVLFLHNQEKDLH